MGLMPASMIDGCCNLAFSLLVFGSGELARSFIACGGVEQLAAWSAAHSLAPPPKSDVVVSALEFLVVSTRDVHCK